MKKSFLNVTSPFITEMIQVPTAQLAISKIENAIKDGATAIGIQLGPLEKQYRDEKTITKIIATAGDLPVYVTNYRNELNAGIPDEQLMDGLIFALKCGGHPDVPNGRVLKLQALSKKLLPTLRSGRLATRYARF